MKPGETLESQLPLEIEKRESETVLAPLFRAPMGCRPMQGRFSSLSRSSLSTLYSFLRERVGEPLAAKSARESARARWLRGKAKLAQPLRPFPDGQHRHETAEGMVAMGLLVLEWPGNHKPPAYALAPALARTADD